MKTAGDMAAEIIKRWEGFRSRVYLCSAGRPTIGIGCTSYPDGRPVRLGDPPCTEAQALEWFSHHMEPSLQAVRDLVHVPLEPEMEAALASFVYNLGRSAFAKSTLRRHLNAGAYELAALEFRRWNKAGGYVVEGLVRRRADEERLFREGMARMGKGS